MKTRTCFVSNSSSSSFIVFFKDTPQSVEELQTLLFDDEKELKVFSSIPSFPTSQIAETVFKDMENGKAKKEDVLRSFERNYLSNFALRNIDEGYVEEDWDKAEKEASREAEKYYEKMTYLHGDNIYLFNYCDDTDYQAVLEHGDIFYNLYNIQISHH